MGSSSYYSGSSYANSQMSSTPTTGISAWGDVLAQYRCTGIPPQVFLKHAFSVSHEEWNNLEEQISLVAAHKSPEYLELQKSLELNGEASEEGICVSFSKMANMILNCHRGHLNHKTKALYYLQGRKNRLDRPLHDNDSPCAAIVPEMDGDEELNTGSLHLHHMLLVVHFQITQMLVKKRARENEELEGDGPPAKRHCTIGESRDYVSSPAVTQGVSYRSGVSEAEIGLANHIAEVMSTLSARHFAFGAIVSGTWVRLTYYSRTAYVVSKPFDIVKDPVTFASLLLLLSIQPIEKLGFATELGCHDPFNTKLDRRLKLDLCPIPDGGDSFKLKPDTELKLGKGIHSEYCLMGRATSVYDIERPEGCDVDMVVKFAWQLVDQKREDVAIRIARSANSEHSPELYGQAVTEDRSPSWTLVDACPTSHCPGQALEKRELRVLLMRKYELVEDLESDREYCLLVFQFSEYVHDLYRKKGLLHRDISAYNMAYYRKEDGKIVGVLIDFDHATYPDEVALPFLKLSPIPTLVDRACAAHRPLGHTMTTQARDTLPAGDGEIKNKQDRYGTAPFMSIEALDLTIPNFKHHVCHELESILYTSVLRGAGYRFNRRIFPKPRSSEGYWEVSDYLRKWRVGSWSSIKNAKTSFLGYSETILDDIKHSTLQVICRRLAWLFYKRRNAAKKPAEDAESEKNGMLLSLLWEGKDMKEINEIMSKIAWKPVPPLVYEVAIYPSYARELGLEAVECEMDCCSGGSSALH